MSEQAHIIGQRTYELTNHLGNVLSVISDKVIPSNEFPIVFEHDFNATSQTPETLYTNDFSSSYTGFFADAGVTLSFSSDRLLVYNVPHLYAAYYPLNTIMTVDHTYRMKFKVERGGGGPVSVDVNDGTTVFGSMYCSGDGYYEFYCTPTTTTGLKWKFESPNAATDPRHFYLDDLSIEDVTGVTTVSPFTSGSTAILTTDVDRMKIAASALNAEVYYDMPTIAGKSYTVSCDIDLNSSGNVLFYTRKQSGGSNLASLSVSSNGTHTLTFTAESTTTHLALLNSVSGARDFYIDNFKVEDVLVNHSFTNNYFPVNSNGSIVLSLSSGRLKATGADYATRAYRNVTTVVGSTYQVTGTLDLAGGGALAFFAKNLTSGTNLTVLTVNSNGTYTFQFTAEETTTQIIVQNNDAATRDFYLDDLIVEEQMVDIYLADIHQSSDYSPFGVTLHGRNLNLAGAEKFRFGFQNQEMDDEIKGEGNSVNFEYRMHDSRLGRFFAIDPLAEHYPYFSPYTFSGNLVINMVELEGLEPTKPPTKAGEVALGTYNGGVYVWKTYATSDHIWWNMEGPYTPGPQLPSFVAPQNPTPMPAPKKPATNTKPLNNAKPQSPTPKVMPMKTNTIASTGDKITDKKIQQLDERVQPLAAAFIIEVHKELKVDLRICDGYRSIAEQDALFAKGRTAPGPVVTKARGGTSYHNYGLAIDVYRLNNGKVDLSTPITPDIARIGNRFGFDWGGDWSKFKDRPHFEMPFGKSPSQLFKEHKSKQ